MDGFYRRKTGRVLKNMKMKDPNVVEIDLLFLFVFVSVLCILDTDKRWFSCEKNLGPWWDQQNSVVFAVF